MLSFQFTVQLTKIIDILLSKLFMVLIGEESFVWSGSLGMPPAKRNNLKTDRGRYLSLFPLQRSQNKNCLVLLFFSWSYYAVDYCELGFIQRSFSIRKSD